MTEQEYLALSDAAKNTLIAERLMGLKVFTENEECSQFTRGAVWQGGSDCYTIEVTYAVPAEVEDTDEWLSEHIDEQPYLANYCGDFLAAWQVVEKMKERDYDVSIHTHHKTTNIDPVTVAFFINRGVEPTDADADTVPLAICTAALKAVGAIT